MFSEGIKIEHLEEMGQPVDIYYFKVQPITPEI